MIAPVPKMKIWKSSTYIRDVSALWLKKKKKKGMQER